MNLAHSDMHHFDIAIVYKSANISSVLVYIVRAAPGRHRNSSAANRSLLTPLK
ncbi:MAG: hypothetical protein HKO07_06500 [Pseudomonadales bacterium]|nr:hypothetical protein [Pseudomonadales bacterium]